ncbi:hypothetical protein ACIUV1_25860 [Pseudomonas aeruginosa]|uniref:hypothetical protein n=1 Tax=Pseudomonas aeruginosa TaxID=287 RepID=UPI0005C52B7E|nr:hypothetical protein [Pseudomonas aeruginosa]EMB2824022.1 hypothetical protein [Pseudomonas aeruginosa]MCC9289514.1 hypothetical protein [Pseudomonas aeruginosa]MCS8012142.1 hypothetical protein [Pseudomonas aeruginosa]MCT1207185.1 hypothetical protein [Pseudomonas aeruginosa]QZH54118.1 hypothetical protein K5A80_35225 [Pseudomonas aeruginosa]
MAIAGFFVDWNGDTRRTEQPGDYFECVVDEQTAHVDVVDSEGFVVHECSYFPTLDAVEAAGVSVKLVQ